MRIRPALGKHRSAAHPVSAATVSVRVRNLAQLFNSLDASPFWDRDLDVQAAAFIEDEFRENAAAAAWHLHVHASEGGDLAADLQPALEHYYTRMANSTEVRLREQLRLGRLALLGGVGIFLIAMSARTILTRVASHGLSPLLDEGLIILAWLALWRPIETLVYGWVPLYRERRLYLRLAAIQVTVRMEQPHAEPVDVAPHRRDGAAVGGGASRAAGAPRAAALGDQAGARQGPAGG